MLLLIGMLAGVASVSPLLHLCFFFHAEGYPFQCQLLLDTLRVMMRREEGVRSSHGTRTALGLIGLNRVEVHRPLADANLIRRIAGTSVRTGHPAVRANSSG